MRYCGTVGRRCPRMTPLLSRRSDYEVRDERFVVTELAGQESPVNSRKALLLDKEREADETSLALQQQNTSDTVGN